MFFGEAPGNWRDPLPLAILLLGRTADHIEGSLPGRADFGTVIRSAVGVLFAAGVGRGLGGGGHRLIGLGDVRLRLGGLCFRCVGGGRAGVLLWLGGLGLTLRRRRLLGCGGCTAVADLGDDRPDGSAFTFGDDDLAQLAGGVGLDLDVGLVALDLDERFAFLDLVTLFLQPAQDLAGLHRVRQPRHLDAGHQFFPSSALAVTITSALPGKAIFSSRLL